MTYGINEKQKTVSTLAERFFFKAEKRKTMLGLKPKATNYFFEVNT